MTIFNLSNDLFVNFCIEMINQAIPLLVAGGLPCYKLINFLSLNRPTADKVDNILSIRIILQSHRTKLCDFVLRRTGTMARNLVKLILSDIHPSEADKKSLVTTLITIAAAFLKVNSDCTLMDGLVNIDVRIRALRLAIDEFNNVHSTCDIGCERNDTDGAAVNAADNDWHLLSIFSSPHRVRLFPHDF